MVEGISINVDKLKQKLQERYPNHNFDIPPEPDTTHKSPSCLNNNQFYTCLLYTSPSPRDRTRSRMPSSA